MPSCKGLRQEVVDCLMTSECVLIKKNSVKDCYYASIDPNSKSTVEISDKCKQLIQAHRICIKGLVDIPVPKTQPTEVNNQEPVKTKYQAFIASFSVITLSEIGDKTFLIAAILAMRNNRLTIFAAASSALVIMTVLSAILGAALPSLIPRKYTQLLAAILFIVFGVKMLKDGYEMTGNEGEKELLEVEEELEMKKNEDLENEGEDEGEESRSKLGEGIRNLAQYIFSPIFVQTFVLTFLAEWGDRSQIATIALAAAEDLVFVSLGASIAHCLCTGAAVIGGRLLASKISVKQVTLFGGLLFIVFGVMGFVLNEDINKY